MTAHNKTGRNNPCTCGSGKKYKKCCGGRIPREQVVYIGHNEKFYGVSVANDGSTVIQTASGDQVKPDYVFSQVHYTKQSGKEKVISSVSSEAIMSDIHPYLASRFDVIFAIDTNTKQIKSDLVSVGSIFECYLRMVTPVAFDFKFRKWTNILFKNCPNGKAEKFAWYMLVNSFKATPQYNNDLRIAIVTDHDLTMHTEYNKQALPIYKDLYLPENFKLIYATSDAGKQNALNLILVECDKDANQLLREFAKNGSIAGNGLTVKLDLIPSHVVENSDSNALLLF